MISLDATASGLQFLSLLIGCRKSAGHCNAINTGRREDAYINLTQVIRRFAEAQGKDPGTILRSDAKSAIMTALYGSYAEPKKLFGPMGILPLFYRTMEQEIPGAWQLNQAIMALWDKTKSRYEWTLPDNFHAGFNVEALVSHFVSAEIQGHEQHFAVHRSQVMPLQQGKALCPNLIHSVDGYVVRELARRCMHDVAKKTRVLAATSSLIKSGANRTRGHVNRRRDSAERERDRMLEVLLEHYRYAKMMSARILDYVDLDNIAMVAAEPGALEMLYSILSSMPATTFPVISVHDCFRVHPNHGDALRRQYNQILSEIAGSNLLQFIVSQAVGYLVPNVKLADISSDVLHADYALS